MEKGVAGEIKGGTAKQGKRKTVKWGGEGLWWVGCRKNQVGRQ